jgi:signal peptidase I
MKAKRADAATRTADAGSRTPDPGSRTPDPGSRTPDPGSRTPDPGYKKSTAREYFESIVIAVVLALFIRTFVVQAFKIPTGSMENNLLIGDHLLVNKFVYGPTAAGVEQTILPIRTIERRDVVVFKYPEEPDRDFIKRVIGLPGETIELRNKKVFVNGQPLDEPYVQFLEPPTDSEPGDADFTDFDVRRRYGPVTVPADHYFVMGDNRDNSQDSRYWGFLPRDYIKGKALMIYWSYEADREDYQQSGLGEQVGGVLSTITHFFTKTRWSRLLHQIH